MKMKLKIQVGHLVFFLTHIVYKNPLVPDCSSSVSASPRISPTVVSHGSEKVWTPLHTFQCTLASVEFRNILKRIFEYFKQRKNQALPSTESGSILPDIFYLKILVVDICLILFLTNLSIVSDLHLRRRSRKLLVI